MTRRLASVLTLTALSGTGCLSTTGMLNPFAPPPAGPEMTETFTLTREGNLRRDVDESYTPELRAELERAREAYRREEYSKAERLFGAIADRDKLPPQAVQEALYYRAECLRLTGYYPKACDTYSSLVSKFPQSSFREQCVERMFDIATYWLDDTWQEMRENKEVKDGKRWLVTPRWVSFDPSKPLLDREGRAIEALEKVRLYDLNGPLADQALYRCGVVKMYHENYREAEMYFSQIHLRHPESKLAPKSIELAVFCKQMSTGGSSYDGRKAVEARELIQAALRSYPQIAHDPAKREYMEKQRQAIDLQQAEKEFKMAEFYRRTGQYASAYWYYELVRRRYPNTRFAQDAQERWASLKTWLEQNGHTVPTEMPNQSVNQGVNQGVNQVQAEAATKGLGSTGQ
jgi:outer membrane protein assembly factor BamD (BamD/ComL family)